MSLVGSLEDLGLGDILQIISLSGKSGVLALQADEGEGKILFEEGRIRSALIRGGPTSLAELLESRNLPPADVIAAEELEAGLQGHVEACVLRMFTWPEGEFSFEVGAPTPQELGGYSLDPGLNPQFLALEGTRRADELAAGRVPAEATVVADPHDAPVLEPIMEPQPQPRIESEPAKTPEEWPPLLDAEELAAVAEPDPLPPLVFVDPDLSVIEWARDSLPEEFDAAHLFQLTEQGIGRIRQYLRRAEVPLVVLSANALPDPVSGARTPMEVVERLVRQAPRMRILMLEEVGRPIAPGFDAMTRGRVVKPTQTQLADSSMAPALERLGQELAGEILRACGREAPSLPLAVEDLREMSLQLRESAASGGVLPRVIEFASRIFSRVALFMVRDDEAEGIAQCGLPLAGGPDDAGIRGQSLHVSECPGLRKVIEHRAPVRLSGGADASRLMAGLATDPPAEAWLAPIESADRVVAVVYGDMLPGDDPIPDTAALEVVLQHAGLALDRAALERALDEPA
ncbi:MAG: DUF4388 domain-containing protein [Deltaproteobacteria bacterium]|nr:DUF4388 domain-containing protein [Deltaproteobacteria bacterium]MBW2394926.1 DUF4388 domain-containing protein [Deltaproteobacteria bacterium]